MACKGRRLGLLAVYRELTPDERRIVDRALEDNPQARELGRRFEEQDALLAALHRPRVRPAVTAGIMAATIAQGRVGVRPAWRPVLAVAMAFLLLALGGGASLASADSLPGDPLFPVKRAGEEVRVALTLHDQQRARYLERLVEIRRQEVNALLELGRAGIPVEFEGLLEYSDTGQWRVAGVPVVLPEGAAEAPDGLAGAVVYVVGQVEQAKVRVERLGPVTPSGVGLPPSTETPAEPRALEPAQLAQPQEPLTRTPVVEPPRTEAPKTEPPRAEPPRTKPPRVEAPTRRESPSPPPTEAPPAPPAHKDDGADTSKDQPSGAVTPAKRENPKQDGGRPTPTPPAPGRGDDADDRGDRKANQEAPDTDGDGDRSSVARDGDRPTPTPPEPKHGDDTDDDGESQANQEGPDTDGDGDRSSVARDGDRPTPTPPEPGHGDDTDDRGESEAD